MGESNRFSKVALKCKDLGVTYFSLEHADKLLRMKNNGGWELADNTLKFDIENGITRNTKKDSGATQKGSNQPGETPRTEIGVPYPTNDNAISTDAGD